MIRRAFDRVSLAWYKFRIRRVLRRRGDADEWPLWIGMVFLATVNVGIPACSHRDHLRTIDAIHARCLREIDNTETQAEADRTLRECEREIGAVGR